MQAPLHGGAPSDLFGISNFYTWWCPSSPQTLWRKIPTLKFFYNSLSLDSWTLNTFLDQMGHCTSVGMDASHTDESKKKIAAKIFRALLKNLPSG